MQHKKSSSQINKNGGSISATVCKSCDRLVVVEVAVVVVPVVVVVVIVVVVVVAVVY